MKEKDEDEDSKLIDFEKLFSPYTTTEEPWHQSYFRLNNPNHYLVDNPAILLFLLLASAIAVLIIVFSYNTTLETKLVSEMLSEYKIYSSIGFWQLIITIRVDIRCKYCFKR